MTMSKQTSSPPPYSHHSPIPIPILPDQLKEAPSRLTSSHHTLLSSPIQSPLPSSPIPCPPYLFELAQTDSALRSGFISREPSLPSIMSMPPTRPVSPDHLPKSPSSSSFAPTHRQLGQLITNHLSSSSSPTSPRPSSRFFTRSSARALSNLCMFEDGLQHYERLRTPSLKGHSRRASLIHSVPVPQSILKHPSLSNEMFELDLSDDFAEQTICQTHWSDDDDDEEEEDDDDDGGGDQEEEEEDEPNARYNSLQRDREPGSRGTRKLFKVGDRVGVGTIHQGYKVRDLFGAVPATSPRISQTSFENYNGSGILEIVRQIGVGSYAVVYLVREVLYDPDLESESAPLDSTLSQTPKASDGFASLSAFERVASTRKRASSKVIYGKDFALKCLCKRNLSDELLVLQRGEAELHRSLPLHDNIVALHRALETPNWLFLVIEYCPGQDLFYWLEQARDSQDLESMSSRTTSSAPYFPVSPDSHLSPSEQHASDDAAADLSTLSINTPPSPSLLASTADDEMLSRRRLRLISKMFVQMCNAVEACHQVGVCHRDIKPENFIVVDDRRGRSSNSWKVHSTETHLGPRSSVIVKITDWGLGTSSKACEDFDCGSKPYMAYECRNNLHPTYDPVQADVWSLGIVLLNLLYHRCPWADPSCYDHDFSAFRREPVSFLCSRFEGMAESVASFLAEKIFCEVGVGHPNQRRISAGKFGEWAKDLLQHMGGGQSHASVSNATIALSPSSARGAVDPRPSIRRSSLGGLSKVTPQLFYSVNLSNPFPEALPTSLKLSQTIKEVDFTQKSHLSSFNFAAPVPETLPLRNETPEIHKENIYKFQKVSLGTWPTNALDVKELSESHEFSPDNVLLPDPEASIDIKEKTGEDSEPMTLESKIGSDKSKRRKRGARKGRKIEGKHHHNVDLESSSTANEKAQVDMLDGLAEASQSLAREISQATRTIKPSDEVTTTKRKMNIAERMMEKFRDGSNPDLQAFVARARAREAAYMGKVKSNTASAPAQLQEINKAMGPNNIFLRSTAMSTSSFGIGSASMSTHSSINSTSWGTSSDSSFSKPSSTTHWSSASHRRERIQKTFNSLPLGPAGSSTGANVSTTTLGSRQSHGSLTNSIKNSNLNMNKQNVATHQSIKKEESKNKLAQLLTSFKRYNSTVGNHLSPNSNSNSISTIISTSHATTGITASAAAATTSISPFQVDNP